MQTHSFAHVLDEIAGLRRDASAPDPLPLQILETLPIVPALEPLDASFRVRAANTFRLPTPDGVPEVRRSSLLDGAWELDAADAEWGLPGRDIIKPSRPAGGERRRSEMPSAPGFVPRSAVLCAQPQLALRSRGRRHVRSADGRRYRLAENETFIYGGDDRVLIRPIGYPLQCICHLVFSTRATPLSPWAYRGEGTGVMAGRSVCVTASHLFPSGEFAGWKVDVVPGSYDGKSVLGAGLRTNAHTAWRAIPADIGADIMVLGLYDPIGDATGYLGALTYQDRWEDWNAWTIAGYPWDRAPFPTAQTGVAIYDDDAGPDVDMPNGDWWDTLQLESYADSASGLSGAPMFSLFDDGAVYTVGVLKGNESIDYGLGKDANTVSSGGRLLPALVNWARGQWD